MSIHNCIYLTASYQRILLAEFQVQGVTCFTPREKNTKNSDSQETLPHTRDSLTHLDYTETDLEIGDLCLVIIILRFTIEMC